MPSVKRLKKIGKLYLLSWIPTLFIVGCWSVTFACISTIYSLATQPKEIVQCRIVSEITVEDSYLCKNKEYEGLFVVDKKAVEQKGFPHYIGRRIELTLVDGKVANINPA